MQTSTESGTDNGSAMMNDVGSRAFAKWDTNGDNRIDGEEFANNLHAAWTGDDDILDQEDFDRNWTRWLNADQPDFAEVDEDGDGQLSTEELRTAVNDANLSGRWQVAEDGYLTPEEFSRSVAEVGDRDRSGTVDEQEFTELLVIFSLPAQESQQASAGGTMSGNNAGTGTDTRTTTGMSTGSGAPTPLNQWDVTSLYGNGWSAEELFGQPVMSQTSNEEIGDVEDLIVSEDGKLVSLVAEVGGFWDIGDTHVSVPWDQVSIGDDGTIRVPVTEDNADEFSFFESPSEQQLEQQVVSGVDDEQLGPRAWRASELIGDLARIPFEEGAAQGDDTQQTQTGQTGRMMQYRGYGYVQDLIFRDGEVAATVVDRNAGYGTGGRYAYPYFGYNYGWYPGSRYYDLPYDEGEANEAQRFDYDQL